MFWILGVFLFSNTSLIAKPVSKVDPVGPPKFFFINLKYSFKASAWFFPKVLNSSVLPNLLTFSNEDWTANNSLSSAASASVYFNLDLTPASSNALLTLVAACSASKALALFATLIPSPTSEKVLPLITLFTPLISLTPPIPIKPAAADIPAVLNASSNSCESVKSLLTL